MTDRSHLHRQPATTTKQRRPISSNRPAPFPVLFVTPQGVQQVTFDEGDRATIAVVGGHLVLQLGERE
jgi:hypothetical protein